MTSHKKKIFIGLALVFGGLIVFNLAKKIFLHVFFAHYHPPAVSVSSVVVQADDWQPNLHAVGYFTTEQGVEVNAQVSGQVTAIHFKSGEFVQANQPLIDIDDRVEQANLKANQAELALQKINYQRQVDLLAQKATAAANADESLAKMLEAEANVEKTQTLIAQKHIRAPFSGRLGLRQVNIGQYITPGQTTIATLQSLESLHINFYLPEQYLTKLALGQKVYATLPQYPNMAFLGKINAISPKIDTQTHNIKVQATFINCPLDIESKENEPLAASKNAGQPHQTQVVACSPSPSNENTQYRFLPGMFAELTIEQPALHNIISIPTTAISYSLYGDSVFLIEPEKKEDETLYKVKRTFITTGDQQNNVTQVLKGLKPGDTIVSAGELKLENGTQVVINNSIALVNTPPNQLQE